MHTHTHTTTLTRKTALAAALATTLTTTPALAQPNILFTETFETAAPDWPGLTTRANEYDAPPERIAYAVLPAGQAAAAHAGVTLQPNTTYTLTAWARTTYDNAHLDCLANCPEDELPPGRPETATATLRLLANAPNDPATLATTSRNVNPRPLQGDPQTNTSDDGANVWIDTDAGFRHAFSENHFHQPITADPINDPWTLGQLPLNFFQADMLAKAQAIFPNGAKRLYGFNSDNPFCQGTGETCQAILFANITGPGNPLYTTPNTPSETYIAYNVGDEDPWLGDPHIYIDDATSPPTAWLTVGGGTGIYIAELDLNTGYIKGTNAPVNFDARPDLFTRVANWSGDEWTSDSEWFEGAALFRHAGLWYLFTSNGSLSANYTIRMGRGTSPTGPFLDKQGRDLATFDPADNEFGNSFLLGDDADQLLPGHPHLWTETRNGTPTTYMGFDYRTAKEFDNDTEFDFMAIRQVRFVNGWPTIWTPIELTLNTADLTGIDALEGQPLAIELANTGQPGAHVAFDLVTLTATPNAPAPCNPADTAAPLGVLDLADINAFIASFTAGCP